MTAKTNNGWTIDPGTRSSTVGKDSAQVRTGVSGNTLEYFAQWFHANIEPVTAYNGYRDSTLNAKVGGIRTSNHVSATAVDLNGARHPNEGGHYNPNYGLGGFSSTQVAKINAKLKQMNGVLRWGLYFAHGYRDAMHFEIATASVATLEATWLKLHPKPKPTPTPKETDLYTKRGYKSRTDDQAVAAGKWATLYVDNDKNTSLLLTAGDFDSQVQIQLSGYVAGHTLKVRFVRVKPGTNGKPTAIVAGGAYPATEAAVTPGDTFITIPQKGTVRAGERLRVQILTETPMTVTNFQARTDY